MRKIAMRLSSISWFLFLIFCLGVSGVEPSLAGNKFETISSGVGGVNTVKREHLKFILYAISAILVFSALLAVFVPHKNPLYMNFANWRQSALILAIGGGVFFVGGVLL